MPAERPNFFLLLELDPAVDDWAAIERRLVEKKRAWSQDRNMGNPKARRRAESALASIQDIEAVLKNPSSRRKEAEAALRQQQKARQERARELDEAIALVKTGGAPCSPEQVGKLADRFAGAFTGEEIRRRLAAAGVPLAGAAPAERKPRPAKERTDPVTARHVRQSLDHLGLATLYDFLELHPRSSPRALCDRAQEIYRASQGIGRTDADASARNALAGLAKSIFQSDAEKARYDAYLAVEAMEGLKPNLEIAGGDGFLSREEIDTLVQQARQRGVAAEDARAFIEDYATTRRWGFQRDGAELPAAALRQCGYCSALAPPAAVRCPSCGRPLEIDCPRCGAKSPSANAACERCGCRIGDAPLVEALLAEGERLAAAGDPAAAVRCLDKALAYWPGWQPAVEARGRAEEAKRRREAEVAAVEELVRCRQLVAARGALDRLARSSGAAGLDGLERRVQEGLARAEAAFREGEARRRAGDSDAALDRYDEALAAAADLEPARSAMAESPPPAPADLRVTPLASGFRLSWRAAGTGRTVAYRALRKAGGAPRNPADGEIVGEVHSTSLDDVAVPAGTPWHYAVFALRGGVPSRTPAASGPHLCTAEVEGLDLVAGQGEVTLRWRAPLGCRRVEVWRRRGGPPGAPGEGTALIVAGDGARDAGLTDGETYGYLVAAVFDDPCRPGAELRTRGRTASAVPVKLPAPVADLHASRHGKTVVLRWTPIAGAAVQIRQTSRRPDAVPGLVLPAASADRLGTLVAGATDHEAQAMLGGQGRLYFVPLSLAAGTAVVGRAVEVTALDPVADLASRRAGGGLALTWTWPEGCEEAAVLWDHDRYPDDPRQDHGGRALVTRREYDRAGCWVLARAERRPYYVAVYAKGPEADLYAPPARIADGAGQEVAVSYRVVVRKSLLRRAVDDAWIELTASGGGTVLPELLAVGKVQSVPLSPRDGEVLAEAAALRLERGRAILPIPARHWPGRPYVKLFFKDPAAAREIRLLPAAKERLRIA